MSDRFRFRYWDELNRVMIYSHYQHNGIMSCFFAEFEKAEDKENNPALMQCTGLRDKNGVLIYESDYLKSPTGRIYLVVWHETEMSSGWKIETENGSLIDIGSANNLAVCGNVHEPTELLED